jgi:hypothetical protein
MKIAVNLILFVLLFVFTIAGQQPEKKMYQSVKIEGLNITIDGLLNETEWFNAHWEDQFIQHQPNEGKTPYQKTEFAILYDENNIYVAIKSYDSSPDSISYRLTRRDLEDGDMVGIIFDSYYDLRTGFSFFVSAAGVKTDMLFSDDGVNEDTTWDPIWWVKTQKTDAGWNAEMRIPLSQLRFKPGADQLWGLNVIRYIFRKDEVSSWQLIMHDKAGFISQFGTLTGIKEIQPKNIFDVTPYIVARTERFEKEPANPFRLTGKINDVNAGLDAKIGLTNYLTMDLTINPDFGQVEADPSEVNLSTYETFFKEKRPFFIEGKNILNYALQFGDGDLASEGLFYSRRIGRQPHYHPKLETGEYTEVPEFTRIIGAAKISGKTKNGLSVGILESVTAREKAEISGNGNNHTQTVEPLTNFLVGRVQKDFNEGNTYFGGIMTAVTRTITDEHLDFLHERAYSGGIDFVHKWNEKNWMLDAGVYFSQVKGSEEAISNTQKSYIHNFQRPDAGYIKFDSTRTTLAGSGGKFAIAKVGGRFNTGTIFSYKTPGLEINDIGYTQQVDRIMQVVWSGYAFNEPFSIFRRARLNMSQFTIWDFGGNMNMPGLNFNGNAQFKNYWFAIAGVSVSGEQLQNSVLRGGPALKIPGYKNFFLEVNTNQQKKLTFEVEASKYFSNEKDFRMMDEYELTVGYRPVKSLTITVSPEIERYRDELMYVTQKSYTNSIRYIMSNISRKTASMSLRINYNITPDLTIQYWGQPFVATGEYSDYKYITNSKSDLLTNRYQIYSENQISTGAENYFIDENLDGQTDYQFRKPDFNVKEFLSNLVVRWEYRPGSTIYLVWSQTRNHYENNGTFDIANDIEKLFSEGANNIFLVKFSYRLGR